jgi:hypothetical protein
MYHYSKAMTFGWEQWLLSKEINNKSIINCSNVIKERKCKEV